jgi:hypothetical protein
VFGAGFQLVGSLVLENLAVGIEDHQVGKAGALFVGRVFLEEFLVPLNINEHHHKASAEHGRDIGVVCKDVVQFVTPAAPVAAEL